MTDGGAPVSHEGMGLETKVSFRQVCMKSAKAQLKPLVS
jgi:hypothetical protein